MGNLPEGGRLGLEKVDDFWEASDQARQHGAGRAA